MNTRVLNIIENPELLQIEDLKLLENEIENIPYAQSLRAIYLLGINEFRKENFQQELTKTAAYTTDKKILYKLINRNNKPQISQNIAEIIPAESGTEEKVLENVEKQKPTLNPITEEKSTEQNTASGIDFYQKNISYAEKTKEKTNHHTTSNSMIDFYSTPIKQETYAQPVSSPISFYERQIQPTEEVQEETIEETQHLEDNISLDEINDTSQNIDIQEEKQDYQWKPMEIEGITPISTPKMEIQEETEEISKTEKEEIGVEINEVEAEDSPMEEEKVIPQETYSNVSQFINTWQNWLKATPPPSNREKNLAIIDKFIENNPKISPINEEVEFNFKEKDDDISHLMTETLAQLYLEQKLYSKAINAYEILIEKYPERSEDFAEAIEEIKKLRNKS